LSEKRCKGIAFKYEVANKIVAKSFILHKSDPTLLQFDTLVAPLARLKFQD